METRSRSAQDRKLQSTRWDLQGRYQRMANQKCQSIELKGREKELWKEGKGTSKLPQARLHPSIQKVESIEDMQIFGMKSAIHELQDLATPRAQIQTQTHCHHVRKEANTESIIYEPSQQPKDPKGDTLQNKNEPLQNQSVQYYKEQINKLKSQLEEEKIKNQQYLAMIKRLEHSNSQLDKEINLLLQRCQKEQAYAQRINTLQHDFKQQLIINLELEELLLKQKIQMEKKHTDTLTENHHRAIIKDLKHQLNEHKKYSQKEALVQRSAIQSKDKEISKLKEVISKLKQATQQEDLASLHKLESPFPKISCNFMERFTTFSKEMEAKLSQKIGSTNPSLQDTVRMDMEANRKKSQSQYSKGNCPSISIPQPQARVEQNRSVPKTDRI